MSVHAFTKSEVTQFQTWIGPFTLSAMGLAACIPEVDSNALLQFVESPKVTMAFAEFVRNFWCPGFDCQTRPHVSEPRFIKIDEFRSAVDSFNIQPQIYLSPALDYVDPITQQYPEDFQTPDQHITHFMRRVYTWAVYEMKGLLIRPYLLDARQRILILLGTLAACIHTYHKGNLGDGDWAFKTDGDNSGRWLLIYQLWRLRFRPDDPDSLRRMLYLSTEIDREFYTFGPDSEDNAYWAKGLTDWIKADFRLNEYGTMDDPSAIKGFTWSSETGSVLS